MSEYHRPIMVNEVLEGLNIKDGGDFSAENPAGRRVHVHSRPSIEIFSISNSPSVLKYMLQ